MSFISATVFDARWLTGNCVDASPVSQGQLCSFNRCKDLLIISRKNDLKWLKGLWWKWASPFASPVLHTGGEGEEEEEEEEDWGCMRFWAYRMKE